MLSETLEPDENSGIPKIPGMGFSPAPVHGADAPWNSADAGNFDGFGVPTRIHLISHSRGPVEKGGVAFEVVGQFERVDVVEVARCERINHKEAPTAKNNRHHPNVSANLGSPRAWSQPVLRVASTRAWAASDTLPDGTRRGANESLLVEDTL